MPLSKAQQELGIKKYLEDYISNGYTYKNEVLSKKEGPNTYFLAINSSQIGRLTIGFAEIKLGVVEEVVAPILKKFQIRIPTHSCTLQQPALMANAELREKLVLLKADSETELKQSISLIRTYLEVEAIPFWKKYSSLPEANNLINSLDKLNSAFCGEVDFNVITILRLNNDPSYEIKKRDFLKNQIDLAEYSAEFKNYPAAFGALVEKLDSITPLV